MLTPLDIHNKIFARAFRGYKMEEVDAFLDEIIRDYESYFRENKELRDKIALLEDEVKKGREISAVLEKTMVLAQKVHDEEAARAKKESEVIVREAESKGEKIIQEAENEVLDIRQQIEHLRLFEKQLYLKHKGFLEFQMELLDGYNDKETILTDGDMEKMLHGRHERELIEGEVTDGQILADVISVEEADAIYGEEENDADQSDGHSSTDAAGYEISHDDMVYTVDSQETAVDFFTAETEGYANEDLEAVDHEKSTATNMDVEGQEEPDAMDTEDDKQGDLGIAADLSAQVSEEARQDIASATGSLTDGIEVKEGEVVAETVVDTSDGEESPFVVDDEVDTMEKVVLLAQKMEEALKALDAMYTTEETEN